MGVDHLVFTDSIQTQALFCKTLRLTFQASSLMVVDQVVVDLEVQVVLVVAVVVVITQVLHQGALRGLMEVFVLRLEFAIAPRLELAVKVELAVMPGQVELGSQARQVIQPTW